MNWDEGTIEDVLLCVVRHALWQTPLPSSKLTATRFGELMNAATKQAVGGLVAASLIEHDSGVTLQKNAAMKLVLYVHNLNTANTRIDVALQALCTLLGKASVPFIVVKGQTVGARYPQPMLRAPGDIDFFVPQDHFGKALTLIKDSWKPNIHKDEDGEQHIAFDCNGTLFEMHYNLYKFYNHHNQQYFDDILANNIVHKVTMKIPEVDTDVSVLNDADNVLYTFLHLYHHLVELGCGLRQFCDVAMLLKHFEQTEDNVRRLRQNLEALGFTRAFSAIGAVLVDYLGMPEDMFPYKLTGADRKYSHEILSIVFNGGNFGFYSIKGPMRSGWRYYVEAFRRKTGRYSAFYHLAPKETRAALYREIPRKISLALRGKI